MGSVVHWVLGLLLGVATPLQQQSIRELMSSWSVGFGSKGKGMRNMDCMLCGLGGIVMLGAVHLYDGDNAHLHANVAHCANQIVGSTACWLIYFRCSWQLDAGLLDVFRVVPSITERSSNTVGVALVCV